MWEFLRTTPAQAVIWVTVLLLLAAVGIYVVHLFRGDTAEPKISANEMLTDFRQLHDGGELSATEFRKIKSVLGDKLQDELDDVDQAG